MYTGKGYYCPYISDKDRSTNHDKQNTDKLQTVAQANEILNRRPEISTLSLSLRSIMIQYHIEALKFSTLYSGNC